MQPTENAASGAAKEFYSLEEVADLLGVNYQLIYKLVRAGQLPSARIGKVYRVTRPDLDAFIQQSKSHGGGICAVCRTTYHSKLSLKNACVECGEPICVDCWSRKQVHSCLAHGGGAGSKLEKPETKNN